MKLYRFFLSILAGATLAAGCVPEQVISSIPPVVIHGRIWGAPVAQWDRASDYGSEGLEFDSLRVYHFFCLFPFLIFNKL